MGSCKLITFNIAHGRGLSLYQGFSSAERIRTNLRKIAAMLSHHGADIVALQEVDEDSHWNKGVNLLKYLQDHTGYKHALMGINSRRTGNKPLLYGNAVLSGHPIRRWENQPFELKSLGGKGFLYAEVSLDGHTLPVVNLHLDYKSRARRLRQIKILVDYLQSTPCPRDGERLVAPVICGDFNSHSLHPNDAPRELFRAVLNHSGYKLYPRKARTFPTYMPLRGIDFVFLPAHYRMLRCEAPRTYLSDHHPVVIEFEIGEQK